MGAVTELKPKAKVSLKDGDGDDGDLTPTDVIVVKPVANGWIITTDFEDGETVTEVFDTDGNDNGNLQAVKCILESMGIEDEIKIR